MAGGSGGMSIPKVTILAMILVAYFWWGCMAIAYAGSATSAVLVVGRSRVGALVTVVSVIYAFVVTSIVQLPSLFSVIAWNFSNRLWLIILFSILELLVICGGFGLQKLET